MHPLDTPALLLLQLLLAPSAPFLPSIWSLLAAPSSITHQDLTEEVALNVTLQLFLEQPPPGQPPLRLKDFLVRVPGCCHSPARFSSSLGPLFLRACLPRGPPPCPTLPIYTPCSNNTQESWS